MIGRNIKRALKRQGKTQRELAEEIGVTECSVSRYIHGDRVPKVTMFAKIADALGVTPDQLLSDKDNPIESSLTQKALDTISRKAAIDALDALCDRECEYSKKQRSVMCGACHLGSAFDVIEQLPSAQPEPCEDAVSREAVTDVIRHSDIFSTWYEMDDTDDIVAEVIDEARKQLVDDVNELPSVTPKCPECDDVVSRRAAIDVAENAFVRGLLASPDIRKLPSVQPERKKGEWIPLFDGKFTGGAYWFHCSKCERVVPDVRNGGWNFCPNCGADMGEETDD